MLKTINRDIILNIANIFMDRDKIYTALKKITPSYLWARPTTRFILYKYRMKNMIVAEVGVDYGINAKNMLKLLPIKKIYLIDPYELKLDNVPGDIRFKKAKKFLSKYKRKIVFIRKNSFEAVKDIPNNLDFIYLDGSHTYEDVKKDIELYYPKVRKGGILGGHDFWVSQIGICKAVLEFVEYNKLRLNGELTDWWIIKEK